MLSACKGGESSVIDLIFTASFHTIFLEPEYRFPTLPVNFTGPSGAVATTSGDWFIHEVWPHNARAEKPVACLVEEGVPVFVSSKYDKYESEDFAFDSGITSVRITPPAWATEIWVRDRDHPDYFRGADNLWHSASPIIPAREYVYIRIDYGRDGLLNFFGEDATTYFTLRGEGSCGSCVSCGDSTLSASRSAPSLKRGLSGLPSISAALPFGNACCDDGSKPTRITWLPPDLAAATNPEHLHINSHALFAGTGHRFPADPGQPLRQLKAGEALGVALADTNTLTWRVYDATGIGAPDAAGEYPLTKTDDTPLPLLDEVTITRESAGSVLYERRRGGVLVNQSRITHDDTQNSWQAENIPAGSRDKVTIAAAGTGWLTASERFERNSAGTWKLVRSDSSTTATVNEVEVVIMETEGGETAATHGHNPAGRKKWTLNGDGSWRFFEYDSATEHSVYSPYGDTPFPGSAWIPSLASMTGIRRDSRTEFSSTSTVGSVVVGWHSQSVASSGNYDSTTETYNMEETTRTTSVSQSGFVFEGFRGKVLLEDDGRGVTTLREYTRGTIDENGFTPAANGKAVMEIVTRGDSAGEVPGLQLYDSDYLILHPAVIGARFPGAVTREVTIYDSRDRAVCTATQVLDGAGYAVATQTVWSHTSLPGDEGEVITETRDGRVVAVSSRLSDGSWEENVDEAGSVRTTARDLLDRVTTETFPGPDGSAITRSYAYDGLTTTITTSGGGLSLTTSETRDLRGRIVSSTDETGAVTGYAYTEGGRTTTITRPGGVTETTTRYLDGRFKERGGSGVIRGFAGYAIDASGNEVTTRSSGPAVSGSHGARWMETVTDPLGRTISIRRPGPPNDTGGRQADVTETHTYDSTTGKLMGITSSARPGIHQLMESDLFGTWSASGTATHTGPLVANSNDRYSTHARTYEKRDGRFWEINTRSTYVQGSTPVTTTSAVRLWAGDGEASEFTDAANVTTTRFTSYDPANKTVTTTSGNSLQGTTTEIMINGFLKARSLPGAAQDETFGYDGLGREIRHADARNASTHTGYNNSGQVEKVVDHLGQSVTYTYYPANHPSAGLVHTQTDAAGKVTETAYDLPGRVSSVSGNAAYPVAYTYDDFGDRETLTTHGAQTAVTTWVHDPPTGLLLEKKDHGQANGVKYTYHGDGNMASRTRRSGIRTDYGYNSFYDLNSITHTDNTPDVSFSNFDRLGRPGTVTEGNNVTALTYDSLTGEASTAYAAGHGILPGLSLVMKTPNSGRRSSREARPWKM